MFERSIDPSDFEITPAQPSTSKKTTYFIVVRSKAYYFGSRIVLSIFKACLYFSLVKSIENVCILFSEVRWLVCLPAYHT